MTKELTLFGNCFYGQQEIKNFDDKLISTFIPVHRDAGEKPH